MDKLFLQICNTGITAGYLVIAILLLRPLLKKAPKYIRCILWSFVGLRLCLPFSVKSLFSLIPSAQPLPQQILYDPAPTVQTGISVFNSAVNPVISQGLAPNPGDSVNPVQVIATVGGWIWVAGMAAMILYALISYLLLKRKLREAVLDSDNVWLCDRIQTPFLLGFFRPRIYLPSGLSEEDKVYVLSHENAHIRRKDHWWKPLGFLLLTVYWFHPLMWLGYIFLCRDIEYACDEKVIRQLGQQCKKPYSQALLNCSAPRKLICACPVAFGEDGVKGRIQSVLSYKKPAFWILAACLALCAAVAVCFLTDPPGTPELSGMYETQKCLYSAVVSEDKQTKNSQTVYDIHEDGTVYRQNPGYTDYLGTLIPSDMTAQELYRLADGKNLRLGRIAQVYELSDSSAVFFQKTNGTVYCAAFFTDGTVMDVFRLKSAGQCQRIHAYTLRGKILEVRAEGLLIAPVEQENLADQVVVSYPVGTQAQSYTPGAMVSVVYDGTVNELYPPILPNVYTVTLEPVLTDITMTQAIWDLDADGILEDCYITPGPTSGLFTFVLTAYENGIPEYRNTFESPWFEMSFRTEPDGRTVLAGMGYEDREYVYEICVENGSIVLQEDGKRLPCWGEQNQATLSDIRSRYPQYTNLSTENGLQVYPWYNGQWYCCLRSGADRQATTQELLSLPAATVEEMAVILGSYRIPKEKLEIYYSFDPAFSGPAPNPPTAQQQDEIRNALIAYLPRELTYLYLPEGCSAEETYPVIVYGYQLAEDHWSFLIYENTTVSASLDDAKFQLGGLSPEQAREKLKEYKDQDIPVIPIQSYLSSYLSLLTRETAEQARGLLGLQ